jgi:hypothetical protein
MSLNPYQAPVPVEVAAAGEYRASSTLAKGIAVIFVINALLEIVNRIFIEPWMMMVEEQGFEAFAETEEEFIANAMYIAAGLLGVGCVLFLIYIAGVVLFCIFVYRARTNAEALGARGFRWSPGWAVGSFFIPLVNLILPYLAMREIYQASDPEAEADGWQTRPANIVSLWWAAWVTSMLIVWIDIGVSSYIEHPLLRILSLAAGIAYVICALLAIKVVFDIDGRQARKAERQRGESPTATR